MQTQNLASKIMTQNYKKATKFQKYKQILTSWLVNGRTEKYPICGKNNKCITFSKMVIVNIWNRYQTKIFQTEIPKSPGHRQTR
jgi:hypothetical protein